MWKYSWISIGSRDLNWFFFKDTNIKHFFQNQFLETGIKWNEPNIAHNKNEPKWQTFIKMKSSWIFLAAMLEGEFNTLLHGGRKKILTIKYGIFNYWNMPFDIIIIISTYSFWDLRVMWRFSASGQLTIYCVGRSNLRDLLWSFLFILGSCFICYFTSQAQL